MPYKKNSQTTHELQNHALDTEKKLKKMAETFKMVVRHEFPVNQSILMQIN
jgi:hypothetical protein